MIHTNVGAAFDSNSFDGRTLDMKVEISNEFKSRLLTYCMNRGLDLFVA